MKEYALYKGEEILAIGTIKEIAEKMGVKKRTIKFYLTPTYRKRIKGSEKRRELIRLWGIQ